MLKELPALTPSRVLPSCVRPNEVLGAEVRPGSPVIDLEVK
jgi:hypothetical protein